MATIPPVPTALPPFIDMQGVEVIKWETLATAAREGDPWQAAAAADRSIQAVGTFGASASIALHGSNDGTNYVALSDYNGDAIAITAAGLSGVSELTRYVKPVLTNGDGSTDIDVFLLLRRPTL